MNVTVILDEKMTAILERIKEKNMNVTNSQAIRIALGYYEQNFLSGLYKNGQNSYIKEQAPVPVTPPVYAPIPAKVCMVHLLAFVAKELGLENEMVPREGLEARLIAAGFFDLEQEGKQWYGKHPNYKSVRVPLGIERTGD